MAGEGRVRLPLAPHIGYSPATPGLQRLGLVIWHLDERDDSLLKEYFRLASCRHGSLMKMRSNLPLVGPPSVQKLSREPFAFCAAQLPRFGHGRV